MFDNATHKILGHLSDISVRGFKLDSQKSLALNTVYEMRLDLTPEFSTRLNITFFARVAWSRPVPYAAAEFENGFQITRIKPEDLAIFERIAEKYGVAESKW
jgi:hypothetical protein